MRSTSFTSEPVTQVIEPKEKVLKQLWSKGNLAHSELVTLAHMYFGVTFKNTYYKLRDMSAYGVFFEIKSYQLVIDKERFQKDGTFDLLDILLHLDDVSENTTLKICVSVKELDQLFESFKPDFSFLGKL
jgi:hypothetical protein